MEALPREVVELIVGFAAEMPPVCEAHLVYYSGRLSEGGAEMKDEQYYLVRWAGRCGPPFVAKGKRIRGLARRLLPPGFSVNDDNAPLLTASFRTGHFVVQQPRARLRADFPLRLLGFWHGDQFCCTEDPLAWGQVPEHRQKHLIRYLDDSSVVATAPGHYSHAVGRHFTKAPKYYAYLEPWCLCVVNMVRVRVVLVVAEHAYCGRHFEPDNPVHVSGYWVRDWKRVCRSRSAVDAALRALGTTRDKALTAVAASFSSFGSSESSSEEEEAESSAGHNYYWSS